MKKITFLLILLTASFGFSQDLLLGFENAESGGLNGGPFGNANALQVNLVTDAGTNGTQVAEFIANSAGEIWQGININLTSDVDLTSTQTMSIDVKSSTAITFLVKVNGGVSGAPEAAAAVTHNGDGTWQTLSFTFNTSLDGKAAMANGIYTSFVIHAYWAPGATVFADVTADERTFYVDNISGPESTAETCSDGIMNNGETGVDCGGPNCDACPNPPSAAPTTPPNRAPADVISVFSDAYTDEATDQRQPFGNAIVTELDFSGNSVISSTTPLAGAGFQYQYFNTTPQFLDLSGMTHMHFDFYFEGSPSTAGTFFTVIAQYNGGSNAIQYNEDVTVLAPNTWHEIDVTFDSFASAAPRDQIGQVIVQINGPDIYGPFYVDNIYFHKNTVLSNEEFSKASFKAYPNPTQNSWNLRGESQIESIRVLDILGKEVIAISPNNNEATIDGSRLKSGIYFAQIKTLEGLDSIKLIKQ